MPRYEKPASEYIEKLVYLNRVSKTVKGGRVMKFSVLTVSASARHPKSRKPSARVSKMPRRI